MLPLYGVVGILVLVPVSTATVLALFPHEGLIPLWFRVVWLLASVWAVLDAPVRVEFLIASNRLNRTAHYGRWVMLLALVNMVWSIAALVYMGWWS